VIDPIRASSHLEKRKRKTKPYGVQGKGIASDFVLPDKMQ
jgi:hypothetical protein